MEELLAVAGDMLTCEQVAKYVGANAQAIRIQAREAPWMLGFNVCVIGNTVRIPKLPFIKFLWGKEKNERE